jgi:hypothetical protein
MDPVNPAQPGSGPTQTPPVTEPVSPSQGVPTPPVQPSEPVSGPFTPTPEPVPSQNEPTTPAPGAPVVIPATPEQPVQQ